MESYVYHVIPHALSGICPPSQITMSLPADICVLSEPRSDVARYTCGYHGENEDDVLEYIEGANTGKACQMYCLHPL